MTDAENGTSVTPINIGFNFTFNGTVFTQATIHSDGILRFGTAQPGSHAALFTNNNSASGSVFTNTNSNYQNIVLALFMDLVQGNGTAGYHLLTEGTAPNRITTIQWKNLKDNNNSGATTQSQFDNLEFQIRLYETTNDIQVIYGTFVPSGNVATARFAQVGIKATSTQFIGVKKSVSTTIFNASEFFDPTAHAVFPADLPIRKNIAPVPGFSYIFYGQVNADINLSDAYVDKMVAKSATAPKHNRVRVKNEGTTGVSNIEVTMQIAGANVFTQTITLPSVAAGADQTVDFSGYNITNTGNQTITFSAVAAGDVRVENNTLQKTQLVTNSYVQLYADEENQFTGSGFNGLANNEIAVKIYGTGTRKISQIKIPFGSYLSSITIRLLDDNGSDNSPSSILHTSPAIRTNGDNETIYNLTTPITVNGDFYIGVRQNNTENMGWQFALKYPNEPNRYYTGNGSSYTIQGAERAFSNLVKVVEESNLPDVGIVQVTSPTCTYGAAPVTVALRNYSSAQHDFSANPVTITGSVVNSQTNVPIPFTIVKNTGTLAGGAMEPVNVLEAYDFNPRTTHRFIAKTILSADAETNKDSINYVIINNLRSTKSFTDSVCPFTPVTLSATANVYTNVVWNVNGLQSSGNLVTLSPSVTTLVKVTATDYRGCTIIDSIDVPVRVNGLPPIPVITFNDTLLR